MQEDFINKLEEYTKAIHQNYLKWLDNPLSAKTLEVSYTKGKKYYKVITDGSAHSFVDFEGNIWKPAGWSKPALNFKRGNIFNHPTCVSWHGL